MSDASFADGADKPLSLGAADADDLQVISSLVQDAVFTVSDIEWAAKRRQFAVLLNRFRWEDVERHRSNAIAPERVRSLLIFDDVLGVATQGVEKSEKDTVLSVLSLEYAAGEDGAGAITLILAGDGGFRLQVEAINLTLKDVTRPYAAPSGQVPNHE
jgi:hypothetical protein